MRSSAQFPPVLILALAACSGGSPIQDTGAVPDDAGGGTKLATPQYQVLAANDLGMHCMDREFSVFSILPPFNVVNAQVVRQVGGDPQLVEDGSVVVRYSPIADAQGSINTRSVGKTDFWAHVQGLFGVALPPGQGLTGLYMPGDAPQPGPQAMAWNAMLGTFSAFGIPITPVDDAGAENPYPLLRISAHNAVTGAELAHTDVVVPVAKETDCANCHATGGIAASKFGVNWSNDPDLELQTKKNVLLLHDHELGTDLYASQPVLCASCHTSPPLEIGSELSAAPGGVSTTPGGAHAGAGPPHLKATKLFSEVMHRYHGELVDNQGQPIFPAGGSALATCYQCHPGAITQCARGAMADGGMECFDCHGDMLAVGGAFDLLPGGSIDGQNDGEPRRPWLDLPRCQSCHTGDALNHLSGPQYVVAADGIRLQQAWRVGDPSASSILAVNKRFAENEDTLYRFSKGHGGVSCESCHGSTHAEWPVGDPAANDNVAATQIQGHDGFLMECSACHDKDSLPNKTMAGPHGMHQVGNSEFIDDHGDLAEHDKALCQTCHGTNLLGTALSRTAVMRVLQYEDNKSVTIPKGTPVACNLCHSLP